MRQFSCECPSGLTLQLREFKVSDEDLVSNPKKLKKQMAQVTLLNAITQGINDPGPYQFSDSVDWKEVLQGDIFYALLAARIETWGTDLPYSVPCPRCRNVSRLEVDLEEYEVKKLPEASRQHASDNTPLEFRLPKTEKIVKFRLMRGKDEKKLQKLQQEKESEIVSALIRYRVIEIEGVDPSGLLDWIKEEMPGRDVAALRRAFDEQDCGVDTETQFSCGICSHTWLEDVMLGADFLFPRLRGRTATKET